MPPSKASGSTKRKRSKSPATSKQTQVAKTPLPLTIRSRRSATRDVELHGYGDRTRDIDYMTTSLITDTSSSVRRSSRTGFLQSPVGSELSNVSSKSAKKRAARMRFDDNNDDDDDNYRHNDDDDNDMSSRDGNDSGDDVHQEEEEQEEEQEDDERIRYDNDIERDDDEDEDDGGESGNNDSDDDDDDEYQPELSTGKGQVVYATVAREVDDDAPLAASRLDDGSQNGAYPVHQVCAMTKQQIDALALQAIMKELVLPHVKFIANGDAGRDFLRYTHDDSSLCQLVLTHSGRQNASGNKPWWKQMSKKIRHALANYRNNAMTSMKRAYTGEFDVCGL